MVVAGGAIGAGGRYLVGGWVQAQVDAGFPWGTFVVNIVGSLVTELVIGVFERAVCLPVRTCS
jgi:CrcB protein